MLKYYLSQTQYLKYLLSIPGVGIVIAAGFSGEVGDISKYSNSKELIKLSGLNLVEISSGEKKGAKKLSKRGNYIKTIDRRCSLLINRGGR